MIRHLPRADCRTMPWANGLGQTVEMIRVERPEGLLWRLSIASVVEDGAFSLFPGIERNLTVLSGSGFDLVGQGLHLRADPLVPVAFSGDVALCASGVTAPGEDFNVMTARALPRPEVALTAPGPIGAGPGIVVFLALEPGGGLARHDLLIADTGLDVAVPGLILRLAVPFPAA